MLLLLATIKNFAAYYSPPARILKSEISMIKLNLGCGPNKEAGYIGVDKVKLPTVDIVHNLDVYPYPFEDNSVDEVICSHILEHLEDLNKTMEELYRICKPNALVKVRGPYYKSHYAFGDATHKHFFTEQSFIYFDSSHPFSYYTTARFEVVKIRLVTHGKRIFLPLKWLLNLFLWNIFDEIWFELRVNKNLIPVGDMGIPGERADIPLEKDVRSREEHLQRYKHALKRVRGRVLDLGCGTGYGSKMLYDANNNVYGIDVSQSAINYAKSNYPGPEYICCSAEKLPFEDGYFDAITAFEVIEHVSNPYDTLSEIYRVLKRGGSLFISTPNPRHLVNVAKHLLLGEPYPEKVGMSNIYHKKEFHYAEFINLLTKKGFRVKSKYGQTIPGAPTLYGTPFDLGRLFPKYAWTMVFHCLKE
jgi:ubiquinone/menaquinone biosynthesis C-methylase UbiE